ncbi:MAG: phosphatase PAP2 family protein [Ilumatobacter sp.]|uniref:phosphatase PAP2 family protein n=1 Tax=Ilumatobacter sp. TaxID=1967498 RepID=UPI0026045E68|nr:phosphatase PAP2 family protein [Ilumatobacter sp.]MDJ0768407.1 phosphatase PAP2 family protein [Ilumatobacter sp.]
MTSIVGAFDDWADAQLELIRGTPTIDRLMTAATHAGEFSVIWHGCSLLRGIIVGRPDQIVAMAAGIGTESLIVNQGLKRLFRRTRPTESGDERFDIRTPLTSSFPSGHASAAAFAATVLVGWDGRRSLPLWGSLATLVAVSRPYVRIHHASDVVGGALVGVALAAGARRVMRRFGVG